MSIALQSDAPWNQRPDDYILHPQQRKTEYRQENAIYPLHQWRSRCTFDIEQFEENNLADIKGKGVDYVERE